MAFTLLHGIFSALVSPTRPNGDLDLPQLARMTEYLITSGVHGLTPLGSTGEFYALSPEERTQVLRTVLDTTKGRIPIVPGTNAGSTRDVIHFSQQAEALGCAGVMLAAPYYSLPTPAELFAHFKAVNDAITIPIMLYNYPGRTGVDMPPEFVARLAKLKNIRYINQSTGEMPRIATLRRLCGDSMKVFCGCDTIALQAFLMGAIGWTGGVVNALPRSHVTTLRTRCHQKRLRRRRPNLPQDPPRPRTHGNRRPLHLLGQRSLPPHGPQLRPPAQPPRPRHPRRIRPTSTRIENLQPP